jgi:cystine transport system substrate-binding protein
MHARWTFVISAAALVGAALLSLPAGAQGLPTVKPGSLTVAFNGDMPQTGFQNGRMIGLDGEIVQWIAESLGLKIEPALMEFSAEIASVQSGRVDLMHGSVGWNDKRAEVMLMTDPIYYFRQYATQKVGSNMCSFKDLAGKRIGAVTGVGTIPDIKKIKDVNLKLYDTTDAVIRDLRADRLDAIFVDPAALLYALKSNPDWNIHPVPVCEEYSDEMPILTSVRYSILGMNKNNKALYDAVNAKVQEVWAGCLNKKIAAKYGMDQPSWFDPGNQRNYRIGVDRPEGSKLPRLPQACP